MAQHSVLPNLGNLVSGTFVPPQIGRSSSSPSPNAQPRSPTSISKPSSKGLVARRLSSQRGESSSTTTSRRRLSAMGSRQSSHSPGSYYSPSEASEDDKWMTSEEAEDPSRHSSQNVEVFRFLDFPEEIRILMYGYFLAVPPGEEFQLDQSLVDWSFSTVSAAILKVSKEVYLESFPVFLRQNHFLIGTSLRNSRILRDFGPKRCKYLRSLSVHLNDRPVNDCIEILNTISLYCKDIRHLELRVSPGAFILPHLASILSARTQAGSSCRANVVFRFSIRKMDSLTPVEQSAAIRTVDDIEQSFASTFRWPQLLERAHEITIKGCIYKNSLAALEAYQQQGWYLEKTSTEAVAGCTFRGEIVTRKWKQVA